MTDLVPVDASRPLPTATTVALGDDAPDLEELFLFAREAELRVRSLRMTIEERAITARGEERLHHDVLIRHPQLARVTTTRSDDPLSDDYDIWVCEGDRVRTFDARHKIASVRARQQGVSGTDSADLPAYARSREPLTALAPGSVADSFVHPHGLFRHVLVSGPLAIIGTRLVGGREAFIVEAQHPRSAKVLVDRPDRTVSVGIDKTTGFVSLLIERIGDTETHHAEITSLELDPDIPDQAFELHLGSDVRMLY